MKPNDRDRDSNRDRLTAAQLADVQRAKRAARWVGLILPLVILTAALVLLITWIPRMPDPAATHWGLTGGPNGFGSPLLYVWLTLGVGYGVVLMMWAMIAFSGLRSVSGSGQSAQPVWSAHQRGLAAFAAGYSVFSAVNYVGSAAVQLDLPDASLAPGIGGLMGAAFACWVVVAVLAWFAQPKVSVPRASVGRSEPLSLADTERAVWYGEIRPSKVFMWGIGAGILVVLAATVLVFMTPFEPEERGAMIATRILMIASLLLVLALGVTSAWFRVRIDDRGLEARSALGWPVFRLPAGDVKRVEAVQISPFSEFGGWGWRWTPGRFGIVMRAGEGVLATRKDGRIFAVTIDDAETAAKALAAAADRSGR